jgi:hypothetical protein
VLRLQTVIPCGFHSESMTYDSVDTVNKNSECCLVGRKMHTISGRLSCFRSCLPHLQAGR